MYMIPARDPKQDGKVKVMRIECDVHYKRGDTTVMQTSSESNPK